MDKKAALDLLATNIVNNNVCPDLAAQAIQLVIGDGNLDADIVFIGEAPGKKEDEQGIPFIGAAGKFLNNMLEQAGMERSDVYITNIVKYRPLNNRDPRPDEKKAFWPYLLQQLDIISPKVVITLGRHSMEYFLPDAKIADVHGQLHSIHFRDLMLASEGNSLSTLQGGGEQRTKVREKRSAGVAESPTQKSAKTVMASGGFADEGHDWTVVLLPLYHPAAALYNGGLRQTLIDDFLQVPGIIKQL
jgi:DNA polymerase